MTVSGCGSHVYHFVEPGETLYSISWSYGHDYRQVASWNDIPPPFIVKRGQRLRVVPPVRTASQKGNAKNNIAQNSNTKAHKERTHPADKKTVQTKDTSSSKGFAKHFVWQWPTKSGKVVARFDSRSPVKKGVDVAGNPGQSIFVSAPGRVVYSGSGLSRYGKLIIVKHNEMYLSAYAHNKRLLVKEGDVLKAGQKIAEMGSTGTNIAKLHFEIRRNGKPVDPLRYLPKNMQ